MFDRVMFISIFVLLVVSSRFSVDVLLFSLVFVSIGSVIEIGLFVKKVMVVKYRYIVCSGMLV